MGAEPAAILASCLAAASLVAGVYYSVILQRIISARSWLPTLRDAHRRMAGPPVTGGVCIIIPAHNEQAVIGHAVRSVLAQEVDDLRLVLVLDRCTDGTRAEAERAAGGDPRVEIIENHDCPAGWTGKNNALRRGVEDSRGASGAARLLFIDADVTLRPGAINAAVWLADEKRLDLLTLMTTLTSDRWFERIVQPASCFELGRLFPLDRVNSDRAPRALANGQFMLFRREAYDAIGGHGRVKDELLEDIAFARVMRTRKVNRKFGCFMADGLVVCRMYRDWPTFIRGWKRIYTELLRRRVARLRRAAWRIRIIDLLCPVCAAGAIVAGAAAIARGHTLIGAGAAGVGAVTLGAMLIVLVIVYRKQHTPAAWLAMYPVGAWMTSRLLLKAASDLRRGNAISWGGLTYAREAR